MLTKADEYPFHQTAETFAGVHTSDKHWNDGHYICLCDMDGNVSLVSTVRLYQNTDVLDGFVCIRHEGMQHNFRASRRLRPDFEYRAGPLRVELLEPLERIRLVLEPNDFGIACDIVCHTAGTPYFGPLSANRIDGWLLLERLTYEVPGRAEGWIEVAGKRFELTPERSGVFRNHSWGILRGRGGPPLHGAPPPQAPRPSGLRNWVLYTMPDHCGFFEFVEDPDGTQWSGAIANMDGSWNKMTGEILHADRKVPVTEVTHDLEFHEGTSRLRGGTVRVTDAEGVRREFGIEDMGWVYCQGGGYFGGFQDRLGQGVYRGDYHEEGEVWDCTHPVKIVDRATGEEQEYPTVLAQSFVRLTSGSDVGTAHYECAAFGPYPRYGLTGKGGG